MGYAAVTGAVSLPACAALYGAGVLWTIVYDTIYAFQDIDFDRKLGL